MRKRSIPWFSPSFRSILFRRIDPTVRLRYGWKLLNVPSHCICGASFTIDHAMVCQHGGLTFVQHNDLRDITTGLLSRVCSDVATEPPLQPLSGEVITPKSAN